MTATSNGAGRPPLTFAVKTLYGTGAMASSAKTQLMGLLLIFYNQMVGLPGPVVSLALSIALLFDAVWDPIIGQLSDGTRTPWGRRHPYIYGGAIPVSVCFALLFLPPAGWPPRALFFYLLVMIVLVRALDSVHEIPSTALTPELATGYDERTGLLSYRYFFTTFGRAMAAVLGFGVFLHATKAEPLGQLNRAGYGPYAISVAAISLVAVLASGIATHRYIPFLHRPRRRRATFGMLAREIGTTLSNRNFVAISASAVIFGITLGLAGGLMIYFYTYFWGLPAKSLLWLSLWAIPAGFLGVAVAPAWARMWGKKTACLIVFFIAIFATVIPIGGRLIGIVPPNGSPLVLPILILDTMASGCLGTMGFVIVASMLADVVEETELKTGRRSEGLLFAAESLLRKASTGFAALLPGLLLGVVRFPAHARPGHMSPAIMTHLALIYLPLTTALMLASTSALFFYKIDRGRHEDNLKALANAAALVEAFDPKLEISEGPGTVTRPT